MSDEYTNHRRAIPKADAMLTDERDELLERIREILDNSLAEQAERYTAELAAGVDAERAEWIRAWIAFNKMNRARIAKEDRVKEEERSRPRYLN
jgi:hypothetical protein